MGSEMCIRDRYLFGRDIRDPGYPRHPMAGCASSKRRRIRSCSVTIGRSGHIEVHGFGCSRLPLPVAPGAVGEAGASCPVTSTTHAAWRVKPNVAPPSGVDSPGCGRRAGGGTSLIVWRAPAVETYDSRPPPWRSPEEAPAPPPRLWSPPTAPHVTSGRRFRSAGISMSKIVPVWTFRFFSRLMGTLLPVENLMIMLE